MNEVLTCLIWTKYFLILLHFLESFAKFLLKVLFLLSRNWSRVSKLCERRGGLIYTKTAAYMKRYDIFANNLSYILAEATFFFVVTGVEIYMIRIVLKLHILFYGTVY